MKLLYIFPHPDDESFGAAHAISKQLRMGHEVYLLTLTKGGATKQRFRYDYSIEEMGEVRYKEMLNVARVLDLTGMTVLDLPDSGLKEMDPRQIEEAIRQEIKRIQPNVVVTYPVHGVSGFHDHLVSHAEVKRAFMSLKDEVVYLKRLAFLTIPEDDAKKSVHFPLHWSNREEIDCIFEVDAVDIEKCKEALDCYVTFQATIEKSGIRDFITNQVFFEIYQENHEPPLEDLAAGLPA